MLQLTSNKRHSGSNGEIGRPEHLRHPKALLYLRKCSLQVPKSL